LALIIKTAVYPFNFKSASLISETFSMIFQCYNAAKLAVILAAYGLILRRLASPPSLFSVDDEAIKSFG